MRTLKKFKQEWNDITLTTIFEVEVMDLRTKELDYITFDIAIHGRTFYAHHVALNDKQNKSKKVAYIKILIDKDFTIDSHLESLYELCIYAILESPYYDLVEN